MTPPPARIVAAAEARIANHRLAATSHSDQRLALTLTPLPLKQAYFVMFLNVQSKYNLLLHWGCETTSHSNNVPSLSLNDCVSHSSIRSSGRVIDATPAT